METNGEIEVHPHMLLSWGPEEDEWSIFKLQKLL
jgi:hypothetical protein